MKYVAYYLIRPKNDLPFSQDKLTEAVLNKLSSETKCKANLIEGKITFSREKWSYSYKWFFARITDGAIQIIQKESRLAIYGTIFFPNQILIIWFFVLSLFSAFLISRSTPVLVAIFPSAAMFAFLVAGNWLFSVVSFIFFIKSCIGVVGEEANPEQEISYAIKSK